MRSLALPGQVSAEVSEAMQRLLTPRPPRLSPQFFAAWKPTAAIDVSDGLGRELHHLARGSGVGVRIEAQALLSSAPSLTRLCALRGEDPLSFIISSGEEYELLFTTGLESAPDVLPAAMRIGTVLKEKRLVLVDRDGKEETLPARGFVHGF